MAEKTKIAFLFGAGAEYAYGIGTGESFIKKIIKSPYKKECSKLYGQEKEKEKWNYPLIHSNSRKIYYQTIASFEEEARKALNQDVVIDNIIEIYNNSPLEKDGKKEKSDECKKRIDGLKKAVDVYCKEWYDLILSEENLNGEKKNIQDFFLKNMLFFDTLDEKFNDLRNTVLHTNGKKVINTYTTIFILMIKSLYEVDDNFEWSFENIFELLNNPYNKIKELSIEKSYYEVLASSGIEYSVTTTNYTDIVENVILKYKESFHVNYLHGRLNWFEDYKKLRIYDVHNDNERQLAIQNKQNIFPFILIPSGVKPMICKKEIEEFHSFINDLYESQLLCVVGYRFNPEDNHINSIISEWLGDNESNKMIYFNYNKSVDFEKISWVVENKYNYKSFNHNEIEDAIQCSEKIIDINIDKDNDTATFYEFISMLKKENEKALNS